MSTKETTTADLKDATTIWYRGQRALRSIVGALVILIPVVNASALALASYLAEQQDVVVPPEVFLWLNAIVAATALLIGAVSRLMAVPGFNAWLTKWLNLGSVPKSAIRVAKETEWKGGELVEVPGTAPEVYVLPDIKDTSRIGAEPSPVAETGDDRG